MSNDRPVENREPEMSPFGSREEYERAMDNLRHWITKLEEWEAKVKLCIRLTKRDLN